MAPRRSATSCCNLLITVVGIESQCSYLFADGFHIVRMCVTDGDNGMSSIKVKVFLTFVVPYVAAFSFYDVYIEQRIYVE